MDADADSDTDAGGIAIALLHYSAGALKMYIIPVQICHLLSLVPLTNASLTCVKRFCVARSKLGMTIFWKASRYAVCMGVCNTLPAARPIASTVC